MNRKQVSILSTFVNVLLTVSKIGIGLVAKSNSIIASGIDSLSDILSSFLVFLGVKLSEKPPTKKFPYGLYRTETVSSLLVFLMVLISSMTIIYDAIVSLLEKNFDLQVNVLAFGIMAFSSVVCGIMSYLKIKTGKAENSVSLVTDGKHSQIDVFSSIGVLLGIIFARYIPALDSIVALVLGIYIILSLIPLGKEVIEGVLDVADLEVENQIRKICEKQQVNLTEIKSRKVGARIFVELTITLPSEVKVGKADQIISDLQSLIIQKINSVEHVVIQVKGTDERFRMSREGKVQKFFEHGNKIYPSIDIRKKGRRTIYPYREDKQVDDFGAPEYLVEDKLKGKVKLSKKIKNPYYRIGRGHGVRFAKAIGADEVVAGNIGKNAKRALRRRGVRVRGRR
ncbi:cation diffusion facilitator family transporter [Candidatus Dojkabacteria bacterium]|nr:cation diffusion facilitator family transporter [Candidatus Dojkabacteria bacterium]